MTYEPRSYPTIVRDLLTTLTGGTVREQLAVPDGDDPTMVPARLPDRPVRRISHLEGTIKAGSGADAREVPYRFTSADFELVDTDGDGDPDTIRFRDGGRRPVPRSTLTVNYYPVEAGPVPLTDLNVGSVTRTLAETFAYELAYLSEQLQRVYESAYLDTAESGSLDRVVALVGVQRLRPGHPVVRLRLQRAPGTPGRITVAANTAVTDADGNRYLTVTDITFEPGEATREVRARGEAPSTPPVDAGALDRFEVVIAGVSEVTNPDAARVLDSGVADAYLRRRAAAALEGVVRGTPDALRFGVRSVAGVQDVTIVELPRDRPGEIRIAVAYGDDGPDVRERVARAIDDFRPAGVRVISSDAVRLPLQVRIVLTVAGPGADDAAERAELTAGVTQRVRGLLSDVPAGGRVRQAQLTAAALADPRIVDAEVTLLPDGGEGLAQLQLEPGEALDVQSIDVVRIEAEVAPGTPAAPASTVQIQLPVHLTAQVTRQEAEEALRAAADAHLQRLGPARPLTADGLIAAVRDDTRYAVVREDVLVTVESDGRFLQLTDGVGSHTPQQDEDVRLGQVDIDVREGTV